MFKTVNLLSRGAVKCFLQKLLYFINILLLLLIIYCSTSLFKLPESVMQCNARQNMQYFGNMVLPCSIIAGKKEETKE